MKIEAIQKGKKYYRLFALTTLDRTTGKKKRQLQVYFVVEVDIPGNRVCASMNGFPAQWFNSKKFSRWSADRPTHILVTE